MAKNIKETNIEESNEPKQVYRKVDLIDRIPMIDYDKDKLIKNLKEEKESIDVFRSEWYERKIEFLSQWDNFIDYPSEKILQGQKNIHIPVTHEKLQAWHARMYKSIFSIDPVFTLEPLNLVTKDEVEATKLVLKWYLRNEINYKQGLKPVIDELLWDLGTDGWAMLYKRWETVQRKMLDLEKIDRNIVKEEMLEALGELKGKGKITKSYKEVERIVQVFSGVVLETVPSECCYFPEYIPTSGDMNHPKLVMIERNIDESYLKSMAESEYYNSEAVKKVLEKGKGGLDSYKEQLKRERERMQGVHESYYRQEKEYPIYTCFYREDFKNDKFPQEYIFTVSFKANEILRATYLDRVCRDGNRPVYKFDLLKRPRSAYSRGFVELLYPLNQEIDEFHNLRRAAGKIANIPWGFYRASSGLEKEMLEIKPGKFFPVDDPIADVRPMTFGNVTSWAMQEEGLAQSYADKLTSMPPMMQGQVPSMVGPLRSTSGVTALMNEAQTPLDVYLDRFRMPFGKLMEGVLSDLQYRLPNSIRLMVLGDKSELLYGKDGVSLSMEIPKMLYMGRYKFNLAANDAQYNPERDKQNSMAILQLGLSQFPVQMGITTPENAFEMLKNVYEKNGLMDIDKFLTRPQMTQRPLNLYQEYMMALNGKFPQLVLNDNHQEKIQGLTLLAQSPEYAEAKRMGVASPLSDLILQQIIKTHIGHLEMLKNLPQVQNASGGQSSPMVGERSEGGENERTGNAPAPAQPARVGGGAKAGTETEKRVPSEGNRS